MKKILLQGTAIAVLFISIWTILKQVDWMNLLQVEQATATTEQQLGDLMWDVFAETKTEIHDTTVVKPIDSIVSHICTTNDIDRTTLIVHVLNNDEINAFALPNGHLVIYSGLVASASNQEELAGVIGHELAHIELNHVMKGLVKEVGLSTVLSISTGSAGPDAIKNISKVLSSTALDREIEKEADIKAVDYMINAHVDPEGLANFLYQMSKSNAKEAKYISWLSTHPDSEDRARYVIEYSTGKVKKSTPIISIQTWERLKSQMENL